VFMSTHILADVERVCDQVGIINQGRLVVESSLDALQQKHARPIFILEPEPAQDERVAALVGAIEARPWCTGVTTTTGEVRVEASDPIMAGIEILSLTADSGTSLVSFRRDRPDLEDIFLHLVGDETQSRGEARVDTKAEAGA